MTSIRRESNWMQIKNDKRSAQNTLIRNKLLLCRAHKQANKCHQLLATDEAMAPIYASLHQGEQRRECVILAVDLGRDFHHREHLSPGRASFTGVRTEKSL